jgi:hypothetical protein
LYVITTNVPIGNRPGPGGVETAMETELAVAAPSRFRRAPDPLMVGLSMVNWLLLMLLISGFLLAVTAADHAVPANQTSGIEAPVAR